MGACVIGDLNKYNNKGTVHFFFLCSWSAISKLWPIGQKSGLLPIFVYKVYGNTATLIPHVLSRAESASCHRDHVAHKPQIFTVWPFTERVCQPCSWLIIFKPKTKLSMVSEARAELPRLTSGYLPCPSRSGFMVVIEGMGLAGDGALHAAHTHPGPSSLREALSLLEGERQRCVLWGFSSCMSIEFLISGILQVKSCINAQCMKSKIWVALVGGGLGGYDERSGALLTLLPFYPSGSLTCTSAKPEVLGWRPPL